MGKIATVIGGGTPNTATRSNFGGSIAWITPSDLSTYSGMYVYGGARGLTSDGFHSSGAKLLPVGTVLFTSRAPIGYVAIAGQPLSTSQGFKSFVLSAGIDAEYVYYYLQLAKPLAERLASGTTFLEISASRAKEIPVPIAPLSAQKNIKSELNKHFSRIDTIASVLHRLEYNARRYRRSTIRAACEGDLTQYRSGSDQESEIAPVEQKMGQLELPIGLTTLHVQSVSESPRQNLPATWVMKRLGDICDVQLGKMVDRGRNHTGVPLPYLRNANVRWGSFDLSNVASMLFDEDEIERFRLKKGDLLVCEGGEPGRSSVWHAQVEPMMYQKALHRLRPAANLDPHFCCIALEYLAQSGKLDAYLSGTTIRHLTRESLIQVEIPVPPITEQAEIVSEVDRRLSILHSVSRLLGQSSVRLTKLRKDLLRLAFTGRLVDEDSSDPGVAVLLENIVLPSVSQHNKMKSTKHHAASKQRESIVEVFDGVGAEMSPENILDSWAGGSTSTEVVETFFQDLRTAIQDGFLVEERPDDQSVLIRRVR